MYCPDFTPRLCEKLKKPPTCVMTALRYATVPTTSISTGPIMPTIFTVKQNLLHGLGLTRLLSPWNSWTVWFPLLLQGQPLSHIFASNQESVPCSIRTLYNYIDQGYFTAINLDLPGRSATKNVGRSAENLTTLDIEKTDPIRILRDIWKSFQIQMWWN